MSLPWAAVGVQGWASGVPAATAQPRPLPTLLWASVSPCIQSGGSSAQPEWKQSWGLCRPHPTPHVDSWAQGRLAAVLARARWGAPPTCQVTGSRPALHTWRGHTPLLTQQPACGRGQRVVGGQAEEVGFGKPSLNQSRTKASAGRLPSPGGQRAWREDESPGIVRQLCPGPGCG